MNTGHWNRAILHQRHRRFGWAMRLLLVVHVIGIWVVGIAIHPGWLLALGLVAAVGLGRLLANADARDGVQEMMAALPMRRWRQQLMTWLYGFIPLAVVCLIGGLAYAWELHQALWQPLGWSIYSIGLGQHQGLSVLAHLAVWGPLLVYTSLFAVTALFTQRNKGTDASLVAILGLGLLAGAALWFEHQRGLPIQGRYILLLWTVACAAVVAISLLCARDRDAMPAAASDRQSGYGYRPWVVVLVVIALLLMIFAALSFPGVRSENGSASSPPLFETHSLDSIPQQPPAAETP